MFMASHPAQESKCEVELDNVAILKELKLFFTSNKYQGLESQDCPRYNSVLEAYNAILVYAEGEHIHKLWVNDEALESKDAIETLDAIIESLESLYTRIHINHTAVAGESDSSGTQQRVESSIVSFSEKAQAVTGYYESNDILFLRDAFLNKAGLRLDADNSILKKGCRTYLVPPFCGADGLEALNGLKETICIALLNTEKTKQLLCPYRMKGCQHWVTIYILVANQNSVHFKLHDSANLYHSEEIETALQDFFEQPKAFSEFIAQSNRIPKLTKADAQQRLKDIFFDVQGIKKINFENQGESDIYAIQAGTGNTYCGGYTTRLIVSLTLVPKQDLTKEAVWNCGGKEDKDLREEDAQTITEYNRSKISIFGRTGNGFGYKNTSVHIEKDAEQKRKTKEALSQIEFILHKLDEKTLSDMYQIISGSTLNLEDGGNIKNILIDIYKKNKEKLSADNPLSYFFDGQPAEIIENSKLDSSLLFVELFKEFRDFLSKRLVIKTRAEQLRDTFLSNSLIPARLENAINLTSQAEIQAFAKKCEIPLIMPKPDAANNHESEKYQKQPQKKVEVENDGIPEAAGENFGLFNATTPVHQRNLDSSLAGFTVEPSLSPVVVPNVVSVNRDFIMINGDTRAEEMIVGGGSNSQDTIIFTGTVSPSVFHIENSVIHQHLNKPIVDKVALDSKEADALKQLKAGYSTLEYTDIKGIFGSSLKLEGQYINLQILCTDLKIKKPEEDSKESKECAEVKPTEKYKDARMASVEDLFGDKRVIKAEDLFKPARELFNSKELETVRDVNELPRLLLVQGRAGIGKTTFVRYAVHQWSQRQLYTNYTWVFTLTLRKLRLLPNTQELSLPEWVRQSQFSDWEQKEFEELWQQRIESAINQNKVLLILDGYDETPESHPCQSILKNLLTSSGRYPKLSLLITTRPCAAQEIGEKRRNLEIIGFTDDNVNEYIQTYFLKMPDKTLVYTLAETLCKQPVIWANAHIPLNLNLLCGIMEETIQKAQIEGLTQGLADLSSMTRLYQVMEKKLYAYSYTRLDTTPLNISKQLIRGQTNFTQHYQKERLFLAKLAFQSFESERIIIPFQVIGAALQVHIDKEAPQNQQQKEALAEAFFKRVCDLGLIKPILDSRLETKQDYEFLHLTFQEYYTAIYLASELSSKELTARSFTERKISKEKYNPRWQIVWWFVAGLLREDTLIYKAYLQQLQDQLATQKDIFEHYSLELLVRCIDEGFEPQNQAVIEPVVKQLQCGFLKLYQIAKSVTNNKGGALSKLPLMNAPFFLACRISLNFCMSGKQDLYALIPKHNQPQDKFFLSAWIGAIRVVTPKVLDVLLELLTDKNESVRCSATSVLGELNDAFAMPKVLDVLLGLLMDKNEYVRSSAVYALGNLGAAATMPKVLDALLGLLTDKESQVISSAIRVLGNLGAVAATPQILDMFRRQLANNVDYNVRRSAEEVLGQLGTTVATPQILDMLLELLTDKDAYLRGYAVRTLGNLGTAATTTKALDMFFGLLTNKEGYVRSSVAEVLGKLGTIAATPKLLDALLRLLADKDRDVRRSAAEALGKMGEAAATPQVLDALLRMLKSKDEWVRDSAAANALGNIGKAAAMPKVVDVLLGLLSDKKWDIRNSAILALGKLGEVAAMPKVLDVLLRLLSDKAEWARRSAAIALGNLGGAIATPRILDALLGLLTDKERNVRCTTVYVLGNLGAAATTPKVLDVLLALLTDKDRDMCYSAVRVLSNLGAAAATPRILDTLVSLLRNNDLTMRDFAEEALDNLSTYAATPKVLDVFLGLLTDKDSSYVVRYAAKALGKLGEAAATPKILGALLGLLAHERSDVRDAATGSLDKLSNALTPLVFLDWLLGISSGVGNDKMLHFFETRIETVFTLLPSFWAEHANHLNILAFISYALAAAYLNSHIICQIDFDKEGASAGYCVRGVVGKSRYCFLVTEDQAQSLVYLSSLIIEQLSDKGELDITNLKMHLLWWKPISFVQNLLFGKKETENLNSNASTQKGPSMLNQYQQSSGVASEVKLNQSYRKIKSACRIS